MNVLSLFDGLSAGQIALDRSGIEYDNYYASEIDKYAMQICMKNFPNTIQLGDITKWREWDLPKIDLIIGGSPCFAKGVSVYTDKGYKNIEDIEVDDKVLTHKNKFQKVLKTGKKETSTVIFKAEGILPTITTENHPYYTRLMTRKWDNIKKSYVRTFSEPSWVEVDKLTKDNYIGISINKESINNYNLTKEECWLMGRYVADGYILNNPRPNRKNSNNYQIVICVGKNKIEEFRENIKIIKFSETEERTVIKCKFYSKNMVELYKEIGFKRGAINKNIPNEILDLPIDLAKSFLDGYMSGDGYYKIKANAYKATTISKDLAMSLNVLVGKVYKVGSNIEYTLTPNTYVIEGRIVNQNNIYGITFADHVKKQSHYKIIDDIIWYPLKKVIPTDNIETVYNLEVEEDNSYTANNAIVHNCQGFSFAGKQLNFKDPRSKLFFVFAEIVKELKPKYFLLENVRMKKEYQDVITKYMGVRPVMINSALVSAQNRVRLYWTNIPGSQFTLLGNIISQPYNKGILLKDIIEYGTENDKTPNFSYKSPSNSYHTGDKSPTISSNTHGYANGYISESLYIDRDKSYAIDAHYGNASGSPCGVRTYLKKGKRQLIGCIQVAEADIKGHDQIKRVYSPEGKSPALTTMQGGHQEPKIVCINPKKEDGTQTYQQDRIYDTNGKLLALTSQLNGRNKIVCGALRGRPDETGKNIQNLEIRKDEKTNTITSVQKDNVIVNGFENFKSSHSIKKIKSNMKSLDEKGNSLTSSNSSNPAGDGCTIIIKEAPNGKKIEIPVETETPFMLAEARTEKGKGLRKINKIKTGQDTTNRDKDSKKYVPSKSDKANCIVTGSSDMLNQVFVEYNDNVIVKDDLYKNRDERLYTEKSPTLTTHCNRLETNNNLTWRKLTPIECERLQTIPDNYTEGVSNSQRYKMLGNSWTVDVICHILKGLKVKNNKRG